MEFKSISSQNGHNPIIDTTVNAEDIEKLIDESSFVWRTLSGLQKATKLDTKILEKILGSMILSGKLISTVSSKDGIVLYTTPKHYMNKMPFWKKFLDSSTGSATA